jgi:hypothetical protein
MARSTTIAQLESSTLLRIASHMDASLTIEQQLSVTIQVGFECVHACYNNQNVDIVSA